MTECLAWFVTGVVVGLIPFVAMLLLLAVEAHGASRRRVERTRAEIESPSAIHRWRDNP